MFSYLKIKNLDFNVYGTHQKINKKAYKLIFRHLTKNKLFPNYFKINMYSGTVGPDAISFKQKSKYSWHCYNPENKLGKACIITQKYYNLLVKELTKQRTKFGKAARYAAFMSHFAVDALNPAHQTGRYKKKKFRVSDFEDWFDPYWLEEIHPIRNITRNHGLFETRVFLYYLFRKMHSGHVDKRFISPKIKKFHTDKVKEYLEKQAKKVFELGIYDDYIKYGWKRVRARVHHELIPIMITTVTTLWKAAHNETISILYKK